MIFTFLSDCASAQINFIILKHSHPPLILHWASPPPFFKSLKHTAYSFFHHLACTPPTLQLSMSTCQQLKRWKDLPVIDIQMIPSIYFRSVSLFFHFQLTPCKKLCKSDKKRGKKRCYSLAVAPSLHLFSCFPCNTWRNEGWLEAFAQDCMSDQCAVVSVWHRFAPRVLVSVDLVVCSPKTVTSCFGTIAKYILMRVCRATSLY